jgi:hypothetical protein
MMYGMTPSGERELRSHSTALAAAVARLEVDGFSGARPSCSISTNAQLPVVAVAIVYAPTLSMSLYHPSPSAPASRPEVMTQPCPGVAGHPAGPVTLVVCGVVGGVSQPTVTNVA